MIVNRQSLADLFIGFKASFNTGFRDSPADWDKVATLVPSTTKEEHYAWLGQWPKLREWLGDRVVKDIVAHDYRIKNKKYEGTIEIDRDDLDDDTYGVYTPMMAEMGFAAKQHPDELVFGLLAAAFTTNCYDGQYMCDVDHPVGLGAAVQSVSNTQAGAGAPWFLIDGSRPLKPLIFQKRREYDLRMVTRLDDSGVFDTDKFKYGVDARCNVGFGFWQQLFGSKAALTQANFEANRAAMEAFKSDEGRPLNIKPTWLVCGPSNRAAANAVIAVGKLAGGADNPNYNAVKVLVTPQLT